MLFELSILIEEKRRGSNKYRRHWAGIKKATSTRVGFSIQRGPMT